MNKFIQAIIATVMYYKRVCPYCKREQVVPPSDKHKTVPCKFCGKDIPPEHK